MISLWRCSVPSSSAVSPAPPGCAAALSPASSSQPPSELAGRPPPSEKHAANHILAILQFTVCKHELPENIQESNLCFSNTAMAGLTYKLSICTDIIINHSS